MGVEIKKIQIGLIGFFFGLVMITIFNDKLNNLINLIPEEEWKIILKIVIPFLFLSITTLVPIGLFTPDTKGE